MAQIIGRTWANEAAVYLAKLKSRTLGNTTLKNVDIDHHLNLGMSDSQTSKSQDPTAIVEFTIGRSDDVNASANKKVKNGVSRK